MIKLKNNFFGLRHLVVVSPWPFTTSVIIFGMLMRRVFSWHNKGGPCLAGVYILLLVVRTIFWFKDIVKENLQGNHKTFVLIGFSYGMILFILSEIMFFFRFFWAYFHKVFSPRIEIGGCWPPLKFKKIIVDPFSIPLLNTVLLLSSGVTITLRHHSLIKRKFIKFQFKLFLTIVLGAMFLFFQFHEYINSEVSFKRGIYGSTFFILTGFHGLHVTVGSIYLVICLYLSFFIFYTKNNHWRFIFCRWYWHFVDVVWLFLYIFLYWYGS